MGICSFYLLFPSVCRLNFSRVHWLAVKTYWACFPLSRLLYGAVTGHWWFSRKTCLVVCLLFVASLRTFAHNTECSATKRIFEALKIQDRFEFQHTELTGILPQFPGTRKIQPFSSFSLAKSYSELGQYSIGQWTGSQKSMINFTIYRHEPLPAFLTPLWCFSKKGNTYPSSVR